MKPHQERAARNLLLTKDARPWADGGLLTAGTTLVGAGTALVPEEPFGGVVLILTGCLVFVVRRALRDARWE